jgi:hypothetical protein
MTNLISVQPEFFRAGKLPVVKTSFNTLTAAAVTGALR